MAALLYVSGTLLILLAVMDAIWTAFWVDGGSGPLTSRLTTWLWRGWRKLTGTHRHRALSLAGPLILVATGVMWMCLLWTGWILLFAADADSLKSTRNQLLADWSDRFWYVGYTMFTVGNGDFTPRGDGWQIISGLAAASGLALATLAITYLLNVLRAVVQNRSFADQITGIGSTPRAFLASAWNGRSFGALELQLNSLATQLSTLTHQHLAYPVLHYYHSAKPKNASPLAIAIMDEALTVIEHGVAPEARPDPGVLRSARASIQSYLETLAGAFIEPSGEVPPPPDLAWARDIGVPTVSDAKFAESLKSLADRRRRLLGAMRSDAWQWPPRAEST